MELLKKKSIGYLKARKEEVELVLEATTRSKDVLLKYLDHWLYTQVSLV